VLCCQQYSALGLVYGIAWLPGAMLTGILMGLCQDETGSYAGSTYPLAACSFIAVVSSIDPCLLVCLIITH
jgi:hypothetical protein